MGGKEKHQKNKKREGGIQEKRVIARKKEKEKERERAREPGRENENKVARDWGSKRNLLYIQKPPHSAKHFVRGRFFLTLLIFASDKILRGGDVNILSGWGGGE